MSSDRLSAQNVIRQNNRGAPSNSANQGRGTDRQQRDPNTIGLATFGCWPCYWPEWPGSFKRAGRRS